MVNGQNTGLVRYVSRTKAELKWYNNDGVLNGKFISSYKDTYYCKGLIYVNDRRDSYYLGNDWTKPF